MAEDWRITATLQEPEHVNRLLSALHDREVHDELRGRLGHRVAVSGDGDRVLLYADTEGAARAAERVVGEVVAERGLQAALKLDRWHHLEEEWVDAAVPLPKTPEEREEEHERLEQTETAESRESGLASWEVRVELPSHHAASALADRLQEQGQPVVRRWNYLLVGANDEDDAKTLGERLAHEEPQARVHVEPGGGVAWQLLPANPFAVFGGLAG
jgi:hypothetical protein